MIATYYQFGSGWSAITCPDDTWVNVAYVEREGMDAAIELAEGDPTQAK